MKEERADGRYVFAIHDGTTYRNLRPIAAALPESIDVEYLLLDDLFGEGGVPATEVRPFRRASEYVRVDRYTDLVNRSRGGPLYVEAFRKALDDVVSPRIPYLLDEYVTDVDPDLVVCGHDRLPFIKHLLERCRSRGVPSAVVQHGVQRLELLPAANPVVDAARPSTSPRFRSLELAKRRLLYRYGAYIFCNPYVDAVYTLGNYFTEQIRQRRLEYPCSGRARIESAGYPEYRLTEVDPYDPTVDSVLYLSGWQLELGEWDDATERQIADTLRGIERTNDVDVHVRPHPKDESKKIERFYDDFAISDVDDIETDIERHDLVVTVYSTALLLAAASGKPCGVLGVPWENNQFGPFVDRHVIEIDQHRLDVHQRAAARSVETQRQFLERYCYVPAVNGDASVTPAAYIASKLVRLADSHR